MLLGAEFIRLFGSSGRARICRAKRRNKSKSIQMVRFRTFGRTISWKFKSWKFKSYWPAMAVRQNVPLRSRIRFLSAGLQLYKLQDRPLGPGWRSIYSNVQIRPGSAGAFGVALLFVVAGSVARWGVGFVDPETAHYSTYYPAVLLATLVGGTGTGAFAAIVGGIIGWWAFAPPPFALLPLTFGRDLGFVSYLIVALLFVWGAGHYRKFKSVQDEERLRKLAVEELGHRLKNKIAMIQSIISYQLRELPELRNEITNRLVALSRTDDLIMAMQGQGARVRDILSTELGPYGLSRTSMHGPDFSLPPRLAWMMALMVHELATNAAKYGALSTAEGKLTIRWSLEGRTLNLEWRETGGPLIASPTHRGFGLRLLSHGLDQFAGTVETTFEKTGLICTMKATIPESAPNVIPEGSHIRSAAA